MKEVKKKAWLVMLGIIALIVVLVIIYHVSQKETYLSDDPLYGSFTIENKEQTDKIHPTDFLLSIDVPASDKTLLQCAKESNVDISKGCWVYSFDENRVFKAEKEENKLRVYENSKVIGVFEYASTKFLWIDYNERYTAKWRGRSLNLTRVLQGFAFPSEI